MGSMKTAKSTGESGSPCRMPFSMSNGAERPCGVLMTAVRPVMLSSTQSSVLRLLPGLLKPATSR